MAVVHSGSVSLVKQDVARTRNGGGSLVVGNREGGRTRCGGARREGGESCSAVPVRVGAVQKKGVGLSLSAAALDCRSHNNK